MEVTRGSILVASRRKKRQIIQLFADNDMGGYYVNHIDRGRSIAYEFVGRNLSEAVAAYEEYIANV